MIPPQDMSSDQTDRRLWQTLCLSQNTKKEKKKQINRWGSNPFLHTQWNVARIGIQTCGKFVFPCSDHSLRMKRDSFIIYWFIFFIKLTTTRYNYKSSKCDMFWHVRVSLSLSPHFSVIWFQLTIDVVNLRLAKFMLGVPTKCKYLFWFERPLLEE